MKGKIAWGPIREKDKLEGTTPTTIDFQQMLRFIDGWEIIARKSWVTMSQEINESVIKNPVNRLLHK
jgi:hypothetical protein